LRSPSWPVSKLLEQFELASPAYRGIAVLDFEGLPVTATFETNSSGSSGYGNEESFRKALSRARAKAEVSDSVGYVTVLMKSCT